jgi:hypothetical protein
VVVRGYCKLSRLGSKHMIFKEHIPIREVTPND